MSLDRPLARPTVGTCGTQSAMSQCSGRRHCQKKMRASLHGVSMKLIGGGTRSERLTGNDQSRQAVVFWMKGFFTLLLNNQTPPNAHGRKCLRSPNST
jgi:hypothetical protein